MAKVRNMYVVLAIAVMLVAAACSSSDDGGDEGAGEPSTTTTSTAAGGDEGASASTTTTTAGGGAEQPDQPAVGEEGSFTVDGTEFAVTMLNRCIPFFDEPGNVDLQALSQGISAKINLAYMGAFTDISVDGSTINEMFGSIAFSSTDPESIESTITGDRWTGSATLTDAVGGETTVDVTWDVMIPPEPHDCSL